MDNKYARGKIYKIISNQTDNVYIGSTIQTLNKRLCQHKCDIKRGRNNSSKEIAKYEDVRIELIENYPCSSKRELEIRERYYIEQALNNINKVIPTRTELEYRKDNSEKRKKSRQDNIEESKKKEQAYRDKNKESNKKTQKKYRENNKDKITAKRHYQDTWCGNHRHNNHNNLLYIDPKLFEK